MDDEKKSLFQSFNELTLGKKAAIFLGLIVVVCLISLIISLTLLPIEEYKPTELQELRGQYLSYDTYAERFNAWANSLHNNDSAPANLSDVLKDDAKDVIIDMHKGNMSDEEILHALNEPARLAYDKGIVDSPSLYDEAFVNEVIGENY